MRGIIYPFQFDIGMISASPIALASIRAVQSELPVPV